MKQFLFILPAVLLLFCSCLDIRYPYHEKWYADADTDSIDYQIIWNAGGDGLQDCWTAKRRLWEHRGTRPAKSLTAKIFGINKYDRVARSARRLNVSEDLYLLVKAQYDQGANDVVVSLENERTSSSRLPDEIIWATMHSGSGTHEWRMADYRKIRRYATRKFPGWRDKGFSLEEMDLIVKRFRAAERREFVLLDRYFREIVLIEEPDGSLRPVNALRIVSDDTGSRLRYIDFHADRRFGKRGTVAVEQVKYMYINESAHLSAADRYYKNTVRIR